MNKPLSAADRDSMRAGIDQIVDWSKAAVGLVIQLHETNPDFYKTFGESRANMMGLVDKRGAIDFYHGGLRARDADGGPIFDHVDYATYRSVLQEEVKNWSYMKFPHIKTLGADKGWYRVGPLARVQICDVMPTPLAEAERRTFLNVGGGKPAARRADVPLGAHDRDAARRRDGARAAGRSRHRRHRPDGRQGAAARAKASA